MRARFALGVVAALSAVGPWLVGPGAAVAAENKDAVAVIIGNKAYENRDVPEVTFAHNDADAIRRYVTDILGFRERNVIDLRDATQAEIEGAFGNERSHKGDLWRLVREGRSDVVVYYSGHGMPGLSDGQGYLLPSNAAPARVEINGYPLEVLYANLAKLNARSVLVLLDACFSGASHAGTLVPAGSGITVAPKGAAAPQGLTVLTAAGADQIASWDLEAGHGLFTEHLLRGVYGTADSPEFAGDGDGRVTAGELKRYLDEEMTYAARRAFGREQDASFEGDAGRVLAAFPPDRPPIRPGETAVAAVVAPPRPEAPAVTDEAVGVYPETFRDCAECPEMVVIPPGEFVMGSPESETTREGVPKEYAKWGRPRHTVRIGRPFALGKYEVTRGEFAAFVRESGHQANRCFAFTGGDWKPDASKSWRDPGYRQTDHDPVACVSWDDAEAYLGWLSRETGKTYRLASESEWEYAARAGMTTARFWGESADRGCGYANAADLSAKREDSGWTVADCDDGYAQTAPVGSFAANAFGVYDMLGNVWEWTEDCWNGSYEGAPADGLAWRSGNCNLRVFRGGSWSFIPSSVRSAIRNRDGSGIRNSYVGFRVARTLTP